MINLSFIEFLIEVSSTKVEISIHGYSFWITFAVLKYVNRLLYSALYLYFGKLVLLYLIYTEVFDGNVCVSEL